MEKTFMVKQDLYPGFGWHAGRSFIEISGEELKLIDGDRSYLELLEVRDNQLVVSERAVCKYDIKEITSQSELESLIISYNHSFTTKEGRRRIRPMRSRL